MFVSKKRFEKLEKRVTDLEKQLDKSTEVIEGGFLAPCQIKVSTEE